jgi:lysosomal alpha-mannosidase
MYSTPSCYLKALHDEGREWTTKSDDFFPYASDPHAYWYCKIVLGSML